MTAISDRLDMNDPFDGGELGGESDPAAQFMKESEEQLGDFADEVLGTASPENEHAGTDGAANDGVVDFLGSSDPAPTEEVTGGFEISNELGEFDESDSASANAVIENEFLPDESDFLPVQSEPTATEAFGEINGFGNEDTDAQQEPESNDLYSAISQADTEKKEPEKIKLWREEFAKRIEEKDVTEDHEKQEWQDLAQKELEEWYAREAEQLEKKKTDNRIAEEQWVKERDEDIPGQQWEKVAKLVDFNPKNSKCSKDTSRMRSILLHLKQKKGGNIPGQQQHNGGV